MLRHGRLQLDLEARRVFHDGRPIDFSARELAVMELLMSRQGRVVTKEQMLDRLFGWGEDVGSNAIEVCVHRVRGSSSGTASRSAPCAAWAICWKR